MARTTWAGGIQTSQAADEQHRRHAFGARVLQRCLEHLPADYTQVLMDELHKYTIYLMQDQFGVSLGLKIFNGIGFNSPFQNYVIQYVLEHGRPQDRALVISKLCGQVLHLARHKFASNVIEKALMCADTNSRQMLIDEIMTPKQEGVNPIIAMMKDQYASNRCLHIHVLYVFADFSCRLCSSACFSSSQRTAARSLDQPS